MRIRVSGRFILLAILATLLALSLPIVQQAASARPIGWDTDSDPDNPKPGDNDGVVVKSAAFRYGTGVSIQSTEESATGGATRENIRANGRFFLGHRLRGFLAAMRMEFFRYFWFR